MSEMVVPDLIEPMIGYKYLWPGVGDRLQSGTGGLIWPPDEPVEAACAKEPAPWAWHLVRARTGEAIYVWALEKIQRPPPPGPQIQTAGVVISATSNTTISNNSFVMYGGNPMTPVFPEPEPPPLVLPYGYLWEWRQIKGTHAPAATCSCGIYFTNTIAGCASYNTPGGNLLVEVAVWGTVIPASKGGRGQFACLKKIFYDKHNLTMATVMGKVYNVPVQTMIPRPEHPKPTAKMIKVASGEWKLEQLEQLEKKQAIWKIGRRGRGWTNV
jgi:hypothetical protein